MAHGIHFSTQKQKVHKQWTNNTIPKQCKYECNKYADHSTIKKFKHPVKKAHIFDGLQSLLLIYLGQLSDDDCIAILDKNEINVLKDKTLILK